jgi:hypothetical protein
VRLSNCRKALLKKEQLQLWKEEKIRKKFWLRKQTGSKNIATQKKEQKHSKAPVMKRGMTRKKFWLREKHKE